MSEKLKPCPFCGAKEDDEDEPLVCFWISGIDDYQICCDKCGANTGWFGRNMEEAVEAWNRRAEDA